MGGRSTQPDPLASGGGRLSGLRPRPVSAAHSAGHASRSVIRDEGRTVLRLPQPRAKRRSWRRFSRRACRPVEAPSEPWRSYHGGRSPPLSLLPGAQPGSRESDAEDYAGGRRSVSAVAKSFCDGRVRTFRRSMEPIAIPMACLEVGRRRKIASCERGRGSIHAMWTAPLWVGRFD